MSLNLQTPFSPSMAVFLAFILCLADEIRPEPEDDYIIVMGMSDAGKSRFISLYTDIDCAETQPSPISFYKGCTMNTRPYGDRKLHFIEAPTLGSGARGEKQDFEEWASWLVWAHNLGIKINGLIYVHSILSPRFHGTDRRGLEIFKRLCGPENYEAICMTTIGWERIDRSEGDNRLLELSTAPEFWGDVHEFGGSISMLFDNKESAVAIVDHVLKDKKKYTLAIQREMVYEEKRFDETEAGKVLHEAWLQETGRLQREKEAQLFGK